MSCLNALVYFAQNVSFVRYILIFIYLVLSDILFFSITAIFCAKRCNYVCDKCSNWACTHGQPKGYRDWIIRDYSKICGKRRD